MPQKRWLLNSEERYWLDWPQRGWIPKTNSTNFKNRLKRSEPSVQSIASSWLGIQQFSNGFAPPLTANSLYRYGKRHRSPFSFSFISHPMLTALQRATWSISYNQYPPGWRRTVANCAWRNRNRQGRHDEIRRELRLCNRNRTSRLNPRTDQKVKNQKTTRQLIQ